VLGLFAGKETTTTASEAAEELGLSERMARNLLKDWVEDRWLEVSNPSRRARSYGLKALYRQYIGSLSAMPPGRREERAVIAQKTRRENPPPGNDRKGHDSTCDR